MTRRAAPDGNSEPNGTGETSPERNGAVSASRMPVWRREYRPPAYVVDQVALTMDLEPDRSRVEATLQIRPAIPAAAIAVSGGTVGPLILDGEDLEPGGAPVLDGQPLAAEDWRLEPDRLVIYDPPQRPFTLALVSILYPQRNTRLEGLYQSGTMLCTQCEGEGFRRITWYPDRPDILAPFRVTLRADKARYPVLLCNGNLIGERDLVSDGEASSSSTSASASPSPEAAWHELVWEDPFPKPSYLFAVVAGDLAWIEEPFTTAGGRTVTLRIYVERGNEARCGYAMGALKRAMRWDEQRFDLEYDLDRYNIVAVSDFNMGAMENKSLNIFNDKLILADAQTATDSDYANIEAVVAHEYFHNWTGNRITCRDWFQLSLKEGLTVFREQQFMADMRSAAVERIRAVRTLRSVQFLEDGGPLAHPVRPDSFLEINNLYTATVYEKGAELVGMLQTWFGVDGFAKGLALYRQRHDGQAVTVDDLLVAIFDANEKDANERDANEKDADGGDGMLAGFQLWYSRAGTPTVHVEERFEADNGTYTLTLTQDAPAGKPGEEAPPPPPRPIPLRMALLPAAGEEAGAGEGAEAGEVAERLLLLKERQQSWTFSGFSRQPLLSLNRGFSAPVKLQRPEVPLGDLGQLLARDRDPFNRWEAGQMLATRLLLQMVAGDSNPTAMAAFFEAFGRLLEEGRRVPLPESSLDAPATTEAPDGPDAAFLALALTLPTEDILAQQMPEIDVVAIHRARQILRRRIAQRLTAPLTALYDYLSEGGHLSEGGSGAHRPYRPEARAAGRRALCGTVLWYLAADLDQSGPARAADHYHRADNMTDRMAALGAVNDVPGSTRPTLLDAFRRQFAEEPLVMDKWLSLQATASLPGTLSRVEALLEDPVFVLRNPNKVRALIGAFAFHNPVCFHGADGAGYRFVADRILELDPLNPQVAARLVTAFGQWRRFDSRRQGLMCEALERILGVPTLSRDVYELAKKSLD